jgi:hypothetical protein
MLMSTSGSGVPGLRREEVAMLAGVSSDYYVRLEQGRDQHPSQQSATISPTTATPSSIGTTATTPGSASAAVSSTEATLAPNRGAWSTTAVNMPGTVTSIVNRVAPRIFGTESTRSRPAVPISL